MNVILLIWSLILIVVTIMIVLDNHLELKGYHYAWHMILIQVGILFVLSMTN